MSSVGCLQLGKRPRAGNVDALAPRLDRGQRLGFPHGEAAVPHVGALLYHDAAEITAKAGARTGSTTRVMPSIE